jgi:hypothetical protein
MQLTYYFLIAKANKNFNYNEFYQIFNKIYFKYDNIFRYKIVLAFLIQN